jgi:hypothetical protein
MGKLILIATAAIVAILFMRTIGKFFSRWIVCRIHLRKFRECGERIREHIANYKADPQNIYLRIFEADISEFGTEQLYVCEGHLIEVAKIIDEFDSDIGEVFRLTKEIRRKVVEEERK